MPDAALHLAARSVALALAAGMVAQVGARHLKVPGIVFLLAVGVLLGPDMAGVVVPDALGGALILLVEYAVAVILFEGGLNLDIQRLRSERRSIRQLVTIGALVTALGGGLAAWLFMGWDWRISMLFGSLVIVTGPTVVTPLLRRLKVQKAVATVLEAEGVLIDAIGVVIAAFALEMALRPSEETLARALLQVGARLGLGTLFGLAGGLLLAGMLRFRHIVPEGLENVFALCIALAIFHLSNAVIGQSGIAAVTVAGMVVGNMRTLAHHELLEFKEQLTVMLIGMLFVLLAADVRLAEVWALGWPGVLTVASLVLVVRPANVLIGTWGTDLDLRQKLFMGWMGPRGIIAAAIASLFTAELSRSGGGGGDLRALVFLVIAVTVTLAGVTGGWVAQLLGLRQPTRGWLLLGAHPLGQALAQALAADGEEVVCIDSNPETCRAAASAPGTVIQGNALDDHTLEQAQVDTRLGAIGLSTNEEINLLFVQRVRREAKLPALFVALHEEENVTPQMVRNAGAGVLFGGVQDIELWSIRLRRGQARLRRFRQTAKKALARQEDSTLLAASTLFLPLTVQRAKRALPVSDETRFRADDLAMFAISSEREEQALQQLAQMGWEPV